MTRRSVFICLLLVAAMQLAVLAAEYLGAVYPLWTGTEVRLKTRPFDPRSLFRGNYARLRYEISSFKMDELDVPVKPRNGEVVYVRLVPEADGTYGFGGATLTMPEDGLFIRGRIREARWGGNFSVAYGIEALFAPKERALALEKELRQAGVAVVMVSRCGRATLKEVLPAD